MFDKIIVSLKEASHNVRFVDQIVAQTITHSLNFNFNFNLNLLIRCSSPTNSILLYIRFPSIPPDHFTYPPLLKACSRLSSLSLAKQFHNHILKRGLLSHIYVHNSLIHFYTSVARFDHARLLFDTMPHRDIATWNSLMPAYKTWPQTMLFFTSLMRDGCVRPDHITLLILLSACTQLQYGTLIHACAIKLAFVSIQNVTNALINMYSKFKLMDAASILFYDLASRKDVVSYTVLINGYVDMGFIDLAAHIFHQILHKDIVSWNLMIHAYIKAKRPKDALQLFNRMDVMPDQNTMVSLLAASATLSDLNYGRSLHVFINRNNVNQDVHLKTALIDMYFKCASVEEALVTFYKMERKDVVTWTAVIGGLSTHGYGKEALSLFNRMEEQGIHPNEATFISVLTGCSHSGLVKEGCLLFRRMAEVYKLQPNIEHFGCLIDALSRAGLLHEADEFIELLRMDERLTAYKILLSACINYSEFDVGKKVANQITDLSCETNILVSNLYAVAGQWTKVAKTRRSMKMKRLNVGKQAGVSSV
ncbi:pentatricopeptide repeat-containing protein At4g14820-like [Euphorbia lathyris]|uniref:pentatricopeptide repeat-containing protein At4g14820-like n=1 Tax=Euphorbia lathyris TaxID=212925 RepID=UPI003313F985